MGVSDKTVESYVLGMPSGGPWVRHADHEREVFHLKSQIKKLTEDLEGYKHIAQRDRYYEAFLAWWEGRKD